MRRGPKRASARTLALQQRAWENRRIALEALQEGRTLRVSNRTDGDANLVHWALAQTLVVRRYAVYGQRAESILPPPPGDWCGGHINFYPQDESN